MHHLILISRLGEGDSSNEKHLPGAEVKITAEGTHFILDAEENETLIEETLLTAWPYDWFLMW